MKMRILFGAALLALSLPVSAEAQQRAPKNAPHDLWCRDMGIARGSVQICSAYTFEQCMASRTSHTETCYLNPRYDARYRRN